MTPRQQINLFKEERAMAIKKCVITTERFEIEVISYRWKNQSVTVKHHDGTYILSLLKIVNGKAFWTHGFFSSCVKKIPEYQCQEFYDYIKNIVIETLNWIEYWHELDAPERWALFETEPDFY